MYDPLPLIPPGFWTKLGFHFSYQIYSTPLLKQEIEIHNYKIFGQQKFCQMGVSIPGTQPSYLYDTLNKRTDRREGGNSYLDLDLFSFANPVFILLP